MDDIEIEAELATIKPRIFVMLTNPTHFLLYVIAHILLNMWRDASRREHEEWNRRND